MSLATLGNHLPANIHVINIHITNTTFYNTITIVQRRQYMKLYRTRRQNMKFFQKFFFLHMTNFSLLQMLYLLYSNAPNMKILLDEPEIFFYFFISLKPLKRIQHFITHLLGIVSRRI